MWEGKLVKRLCIAFILAAILAAVLGWGIQWVINGGWPGSGPVGESTPPHIQYVTPADGIIVSDSFGFCVNFNYETGYGLGDNPQDVIRYYLDGINVTEHVNDIVTLEYGYPDPIGEPCYNSSKLLRSGWYTAKVKYQDTEGNPFEYTWRFGVIDGNVE